MSDIVNDQFATWTHGTSFTPSAGTQLADGWFAVGGGSMSQQSNPWVGFFDYTSNFYMQTTGAIYQDINLGFPITGITIEHSVVSNISSPTCTCTIHDGIQSDSNTSLTVIHAPGAPTAPTTVFIPFSTSAATIRITFTPNNNQEFRMFKGTLAGPLLLSLSDSATLTSSEANQYAFHRTESDSVTPTVTATLTKQINMPLNDFIFKIDDINLFVTDQMFNDSVLFQEWISFQTVRNVFGE